jgi:hypothetical protein
VVPQVASGVAQAGARPIEDRDPASGADCPVRRSERSNAESGGALPGGIPGKLVDPLILMEESLRSGCPSTKVLLSCRPMTNFEAQIFNDSARYALLLAEQLQEQAVRDNILKLVRVWLAAARDLNRPVIPMP